MENAPNSYHVETRELETVRRKYQVASALLDDHRREVDRLTAERDNFRASYYRLRELILDTFPEFQAMQVEDIPAVLRERLDEMERVS